MKIEHKNLGPPNHCDAKYSGLTQELAIRCLIQRKLDKMTFWRNIKKWAGSYYRVHQRITPKINMNSATA